MLPSGASSIDELDHSVPVDDRQALCRRDILGELSNIITYFSQHISSWVDSKKWQYKQGEDQDEGWTAGKCLNRLPADAGLSERWQDVGGKLAEIVT